MLCLHLLAAGVLTAGLGHGFKAAVYEHVLRGDREKDPFEEVVAKNLESYGQAVLEAAAQGCDIIVFPEKGLMVGLETSRDKLTQHAEDIPGPGTLPCLDGKESRPLLSKLSCMARANRIYLVVNVYDQKPCPEGTTSCPSDNRLFYNTNVAFDRTGTIVARYHKNHLFLEPPLNVPEPFETAVFETDFGERAGMFICYDILYAEASELVTRHNISLALMSTFWFDFLPGLYSVAVQQAWSLRHGVPLLSAGVQRPETGTMGSGIYAGASGPLVYSHSPDGRSKLLVADMDAAPPEDSRYAGDTQSTEGLSYLNLRTDGYVVRKLPGASGEMNVCNGDFCCHLSYESPDFQDPFFLLVVNGQTQFIPAEACVLTVCHPGNDQQPCAVFPTRSRTRFTRLLLEARYSSTHLFPMVASDELILTPVRYWTFETSAVDNTTSFAIDERDPPAEPILHVFLVAFAYQDDPTTRQEHIASALRRHQRSRVKSRVSDVSRDGVCPTGRDVCALDEGPRNGTMSATKRPRRPRRLP
uniref:Putative biotinidase and vanin n=1 Tax=Ixodes scapularis TaxID=6945 RepID=A0A4D5RLF5_IXOSC